MFNLGDKFEERFTITPSTYEGFIGVLKDTNPLHTNAQFAEERGFNGCVMHGNILNGFLSYFIGECLPDKNVVIHSQQIQFKNAVYLNDKLSFEAEIIGIHQSLNTVEFKYSFKNAAAK